MTFLKGFVKGKLNNIKNLEIDKDKLYNIEDLPENSITNEIMDAALTDNKAAAFLTLNNTYVCIDDGNYIKGHTYKFNGDSWEDITVGGIEQLVGTQEKPINFASDMEVGHLYFIEGFVHRANNATIHISTKSLTYKVNTSSVYIENCLIYNQGVATIVDGVLTCVSFIASTGNFNSIYTRGGIKGLNGQLDTTHHIYAPTTSGIQGQILQSSGYGAPIWIDSPGGISGVECDFYTLYSTIYNNWDKIIRIELTVLGGGVGVPMYIYNIPENSRETTTMNLNTGKVFSLYPSSKSFDGVVLTGTIEQHNMTIYSDGNDMGGDGFWCFTDAEMTQFSRIEISSDVFRAWFSYKVIMGG